MKIKLSPINILVMGIVFIFLVFGLMRIFAKRDKQISEPTNFQEITNPIHVEIPKPSTKNAKGIIVRPAASNEIEAVRQKLNLPAEEEKDSRKSHEEILKKDPQIKFIF